MNVLNPLYYYLGKKSGYELTESVCVEFFQAAVIVMMSMREKKAHNHTCTMLTDFQQFRNAVF